MRAWYDDAVIAVLRLKFSAPMVGWRTDAEPASRDDGARLESRSIWCALVAISGAGVSVPSGEIE